MWVACVGPMWPPLTKPDDDHDEEDNDESFSPGRTNSREQMCLECMYESCCTVWGMSTFVDETQMTARQDRERQ